MPEWGGIGTSTGGGGESDGEVRIRFIVDGEDAAARAVRDVDGSLVRLETNSGKAAGGISRLTGALKGIIAAMAVERLVAYTQRMFDLGSAAAETASKFVAVFGPAAASVDARLREMANAMGLTLTEAREMAGTLGNVFTAQGMTAEAAGDLSIRMISLAGDMASFNNVPTTETLAALQSALRGEFDPLERFAGGVTAATVAMKAMEMTGKTNEKQLTAQEKQLAVLELATIGAGKAIGDLERTQDGAANSARRHMAEIREMEQVFATALLPTFGLVLTELGALIEGNQATGRSFAEKLARGVLYTVSALIQGGKAIGGMIGALSGLSRGLTGTADTGFGAFETGVTNFLNNINLVSAGISRLEQFLKRGEISVLENQISFQRQAIRIEESIGGDRVEGMNIALQGMLSQLWSLQGAAERAGGRVDDLLATIRGRTATGAFSDTVFQQALADVSELASMALPDIAAITAEAVSDAGDAAVAATTDAARRTADAAERGRTEAEQRRRLSVDRAFEQRELEVKAMRSGADKTVAEIALNFDRQREAYVRQYGPMADAIEALFARLQAQAELSAAKLAETVSGAGSERTRANAQPGLGDVQDFGPEDTAQRAAMQGAQDLEDMMRNVAVVAVDTSQTAMEAMSGLFANYGGALAGVLSMLQGAFGQSAQESKAAFEIQKALAVANATIATYEGATQAYKALAGIPVVGPGLGIAAAAAVTAAGAMNVRRILGTQFGGKGGPKGASYGSGPGASGLSGGLALGAALSPTQRGATAAPIVVPAPQVTYNPPPTILVVNDREIARTNDSGQARITRTQGARHRRG